MKLTLLLLYAASLFLPVKEVNTDKPAMIAYTRMAAECVANADDQEEALYALPHHEPALQCSKSNPSAKDESAAMPIERHNLPMIIIFE